MFLLVLSLNIKENGINLNALIECINIKENGINLNALIECICICSFILTKGDHGSDIPRKSYLFECLIRTKLRNISDVSAVAYTCE